MTERVKYSIEPASKRIKEEMERYGVCVDLISTKDIVEIFKLQAKNDVSGDNPKLKRTSFIYYPDRIFFSFDYSIAEKENSKKSLGLKLSGNIINGTGFGLSDKETVSIESDDQKMKERVYSAFEKKDSLSVPEFIDSMILDALNLDAHVFMKLNNDKLVVILQSKKSSEQGSKIV